MLIGFSRANVSEAVDGLCKKTFIRESDGRKLTFLSVIQEGRGSKAAIYRDNVFNGKPYELTC